MDIEHDDDEEDDDDYEYSDEEESSDEDEDEKKWGKNFFRLIILKMHAQYDEIKKGKIIIIWFSKKTIFFPPSFNFWVVFQN